MTILKINEPFWSAWKKYGWTPKVPGIGIKKEFIQKMEKEGGTIFVRIGKEKQVWQISTTKAINLAKKHNSVYHARRGVTLYVIPQDALEKATTDEKTDSEDSTG